MTHICDPAEWVREMTSSGVKATIDDLTPAIASFLLENNNENRIIRQHVVDSYARDMANGKWAVNGEPIIISSDGQLNDGQHRCWAVIQCGRSVRTAFVFGVGRDTRSTVDQGIARRLSDYLQMEGVVTVNATRVATLAAMVYRYKSGGSVAASSGRDSGKTARATKQELVELVERDLSIQRAVNLCPTEGKQLRSVASASIFMFFLWLVSKTNEDHEVVSFLEKIIKGLNLNAGDPELYVRGRLMAEKGRMRPNEATELLIRGWNAHCRGEKVRSLPINGGKLPEVKKYRGA